MQEVRCKECNKLLMKSQVLEETINVLNKNNVKEPYWYEIKCPRCGHMNTNKKESVEDGRIKP
jgi:phage FluMu protein Com